MEIFQGTEGFGNAVLGTIKVIGNNDQSVSENVLDKDAEIEKYKTAKDRLNERLESEKKELELPGPENEHRLKHVNTMLMLLNDHQFEDAVLGRILTQQLSARKAIFNSGEYLKEILSYSDDDYIRSKGNVYKDMAGKMLSCLEDYDGPDSYLPDNCIIAARHLSSAEFLLLDKEKVKGLIIEHSSGNSHVAILAKAMNIPTIIGCEVDESWDGMTACADGGWRVVYLDPDDATINDMKERILEDETMKQHLKQLKGKECITSDGRKINLFANICSTSEIAAALDNDADAIGLYRTEAAYVNTATPPREEQLFYEYRTLATAMGHKPVVIRTADLGTDRHIYYIDLKREENAALGIRGIRLSLKFKDLFKTQLRAILRAAAYGELGIMFPMISTVREFLAAKEMVEECYRELIAEEIPCREVKLGAMIETPAAALISDELAKHADFLSIGTNDLTQYTLGVDRENKELADMIDYHHPAILKLLKMICDNAHKLQKPVGICGELAMDERLSGYFLDIGVDSLSVIPQKILSMRDHIINL